MGEWILTEEEMEAEHFWGPLVDYGYDAIKCLAIEQDAKTKRILEQEGLRRVAEGGGSLASLLGPVGRLGSPEMLSH